MLSIACEASEALVTFPINTAAGQPPQFALRILQAHPRSNFEPLKIGQEAVAVSTALHGEPGIGSVIGDSRSLLGKQVTQAQSTPEDVRPLLDPGRRAPTSGSSQETLMRDAGFPTQVAVEVTKECISDHQSRPENRS